jgi:DNA modification methylase
LIHQGDALNVLKTFEPESIDCCVTSPPYWALRDYKVEGQLGLEPTFHEYIDKLCTIFDQVKRVLKKTGSCWVVLGDTYSLEKSLCLIPERFVIEMINRGWILRNKIIWHKRNCMPSSAKDRFTVDHEFVYFFVKSQKYYFETQYEPLEAPNRKQGDWVGGNKYIEQHTAVKNPGYHINPLGRIKRCVWRVSTKPYSGAHFAVFPEQLIETPIKATCPVDGIVLDPFMGAGTTGLVALKNARRFVGIELNPEYIELANKRLKSLLLQTKLIVV